MKEQPCCILCGQPCLTGLNVMGCLICFPCEKALLRPLSTVYLPAEKRRKLFALCRGEAPADCAAFPELSLTK